MKKLLLITAGIFLLFTTSKAQATDTLFVNPTATGSDDGSSWTNAFTDARDAFISAARNTEIWIAEGTYIRNATDRNSVFGWTVDSIMVYGGFAGGETSRDQRDWNANPTIFSGDIGIIGDASDNAYTVFAGPISDPLVNFTFALIDGIKITGGNANNNTYPDFNSVGGGIALDPLVDYYELSNIEFYNNYAKQGAAISVYTYTTQLVNIKLNNIVAHDNQGGSSAFGHFRSNSGGPISLEMTNCLIHENEAIGSSEDYGTVLFVGSSPGSLNGIDATIINCTFADNTFNSSNDSKGVLRTYQGGNSSSSLQLSNSIFYGNGISEITATNGNFFTELFSSTTFSNNILQNGIGFITLENNTYTFDPMFTSTYELQVGSPAIDSGTMVGVNLPLLDLAGNDRVLNGKVDLGCYEFTCTAITTSLSLNNDEFTVSGATSYEWFFNNTPLNLNNATTYTPTQDGDYYVIGTGVDGCIDSSNVISFCGSFAVDISESNGTFTTTSGLNNYQWFLNGSAISGANTNSYTAITSGAYYVEAEQNGCTSSSNTINYTGVSIKNINSFNALKIYPNPTTGIIRIEIAESLSSTKLINITGQTIMQINPNTKQIDLSELNAGIYFLEIANAEKKSVIKIIKK